MMYNACPHCGGRISPLARLSDIHTNKVHCSGCQQDAESFWGLALRGAAGLALIGLVPRWGDFVHSSLAGWVMGVFFALVLVVIPELLPLRKWRPASFKGWVQYVLMLLPLLLGVSVVATLISRLG